MGQKASASPVWSRPPPVASSPERAADSGGSGLAVNTTSVTRLMIPRSAAAVLNATSIPAANAHAPATGTASKW